MRKWTIAGGSSALLLSLVAVAWAAGDWSSAKDKAEKFEREYKELRDLTPKETRGIVEAICAADEEARKDVASSAHDRAADNVKSKFRQLENMKDDTVRALDDVINDENLKDRQSDAKSYRDDTIRRWETIERMSSSLRGKNHPVVRYMIEEGNKAHERYQDGGGLVKCDVKEYSTGGGRSDCINADKCLVVEIKPDNSRAVGRGKGQAAGYASDLNNSKEKREELAKRNSSFAKCVDQKFTSRVDCYKLCPEIDRDSNEMRSTSVTWDDDC